MKFKIAALCLVSSCLTNVNAEESVATRNCGSVAVVSGQDCQDLKVEFKLADCGLKVKTVLATQVSCKGDRLTAKYKDGQYQVEAKLDKRNDGWSGLAWTKVGEVKITEKALENSAERKPAKNADDIKNIIDNPEPTSVGAFKFSAFFDFRYTSFSAKDSPLVASDHSESGFGLEDGAVYVNYEKDRLAMVGDLAFRRQKDIDTDSSASRPNQSSNGNLAIGNDKSQIYLKYKLKDNLNLYLGQFDTIFGVELNDSKDRVFNKAGLVYDATLPVTHTGVMVEYTFSGAYLKALSANPNNKGTNGTSAAGDESTEYGAALGYSNENFRCQAGYMTRPISTADQTARGNRSLMDVTAGVTYKKVSLDAEYAVVTDPAKNTLTSSDTSDKEGAGTGLLVLGTYRPTDTWLLGVRYEALNKDPAGLAVKSANAVGAALHYKVSSELTLRSEYIDYKYKNTSDQSWNESRFILSTLITF